MTPRAALSSVLALLCASALLQAQIPMSVADVDEAIEKIGEVIEREHANPDAGVEIRRSLREGLSEGRFPSFYSAEDVARGLTLELYELTRDRRLTVSVVKAVSPGESPDLGQAEQVRRTNAGLSRVDVLPGNVGYVHLSAFWPGPEAREAIATAMHLLRNTDALIVDVRDSSGGGFETAAVLASYLFASPSLPLLEVTYRSAPPSRYTTLSPLVADHNATRPVYVLTSTRTASAGEAFAWLVQDGKRGEAVGERTAGEAGSTRAFRVGDRFDVTVPNGVVKSGARGVPLGQTGVKPDVATNAGDALRVAHARALRRLIAMGAPRDWRDRLAKELESF